MASSKGRFVWSELHTTDRTAAMAFYAEIVGWGGAPWEGQPYTMLLVGDKHVGGIMDQPEESRKMGAPPAWLLYIATDDVDATARQAAALGGTVHVSPTDIPEVGRFAVIQDPQGAVFAAWKSVREGDAHPSGRGTLSWRELTTTDAAAAFTFYEALFGWEQTDSFDMGPNGTYQMYGAGGETYGGIMNKPPEMPSPPFWLGYFSISDVHAASEVVKRLGGKVLNGPMEVPGGDWIVQCMDPQGACFALHSPKPT